MMKKMKTFLVLCMTGVILLAGCGKSTDANDISDKLKDKIATATEEEKDKEEKQEKEEKKESEDLQEEAATQAVESEGKKESEEESKPEKEEDTDYEASYSPVLDEVLEAVTDGYDFEKGYKYISDGLMEKCMYPGDGDLTETVGYVLEDISGDGIPELIVGCDEAYGDNGPKSYIFSVLTLKNDKPFKVFDGWARSSYNWMGDDHFYYSGSGGAAITIFGENHLSRDGSEIIWDDFYFSDEKDGGEIGLYHNTTGVFDAKEAEELQISQSEFFSKMDDYESVCKLLSWTPIGSYKGSGH